MIRLEERVYLEDEDDPRFVKHKFLDNSTYCCDQFEEHIGEEFLLHPGDDDPHFRLSYHRPETELTHCPFCGDRIEIEVTQGREYEWVMVLISEGRWKELGTECDEHSPIWSAPGPYGYCHRCHALLKQVDDGSDEFPPEFEVVEPG